MCCAIVCACRGLLTLWMCCSLVAAFVCVCVHVQVAAEFPGLSASGSDLQHLLTSCPSSLMYSWASPELVRGATACQQ